MLGSLPFSFFIVKISWMLKKSNNLTKMAKGILITQRTFEDFMNKKKVTIKVKTMMGTKCRYTKVFDSGNAELDMKNAREYISKRNNSRLLLTKSI